jgi:hypothetical protein
LFLTAHCNASPISKEAQRRTYGTIAAEAAKQLRLLQQSQSPQEALAIQATESLSEPAWETRSLELQPEAKIAAPTKGIEMHSGNSNSSGSSSKSFTDNSLAQEYNLYNWADLLEIVTLGSSYTIKI